MFSRQSRAVVVVLLLCFSAAGCGSSGGLDATTERERSTATNVQFKGCDKVQCTGELTGAKYEVKLPDKWNGTLLLWSHGYRQAQPAPPDFNPVETNAEAAPSDETAADLLSKGYALAGSAFATNGWDVLDGVRANEALHAWFSSHVARPYRTYVWGESLGGLITQTLAEKHPEWVTAAAPLCGVLGGTNHNLDLALDVTYAIKSLLVPDLKLTDYASFDEAVTNFNAAYKAVLAATKDIQNGVPKLLVIAAIVDSPQQTRAYDGHDTPSQLGAVVESLLTAVGYGTYGRWELEQRVGGNASSNSDTDYAARISDTEKSLPETVSAGSVARNLALLAQGQRVEADAAARAKADTLGNPTGVLKDPTLTLHTVADPLVVVQNEQVFRKRVLAATTRRSADLLQLYTRAPETYTTAPYGAGHCNFTTQELAGVVSLLDLWARQGSYPTTADVTTAFANDPGLDLGYGPAPWPDPKAE